MRPMASTEGPLWFFPFAHLRCSFVGALLAPLWSTIWHASSQPRSRSFVWLAVLGVLLWATRRFFPRGVDTIRLVYRPAAIVGPSEKAGPRGATSPSLASPSQTHG